MCPLMNSYYFDFAFTGLIIFYITSLFSLNVYYKLFAKFIWDFIIKLFHVNVLFMNLFKKWSYFKLNFFPFEELC